VYEILCSEEAPPNPEEHWEGWIARRIVAALSTLPQAAAAVPLSEEQIVAIGLANKLDPWRSSVVDPVKFARGIEAAHGITPLEGTSE
jgi:hypothetical protein